MTSEHLILEGYVHISKRTDLYPEISKLRQSGKGGHSPQSQTLLHRSTVVGLELTRIAAEVIGVELVVVDLLLWNHIATVRAAPAQVVPEDICQVGKKHLQVQLLVVLVAVCRKMKAV